MTVKKSGAIHHYSGLSTDTKPTGTTVAPGSTFYEFDTNDTYFTNDASTWVVKDSKSVKKFSVTMTVSGSAAYAANDVISDTETASSANTWDFSSISAYNGGTGKVVQASLVCETAAASIEGRIYIFNGTPNGAVADNAANTSPVWADVSSDVFIGRIDLPKMNARGVAIAPETSSSLPLYFTTPTSADDIYAILTTATAATIDSSSRNLTLSLWVKRL